MAVRLLFLLFVIIRVGFSYISLLNGQHIQFSSPPRARWKLR
jgi:hypothetical protein